MTGTPSTTTSAPTVFTLQAAVFAAAVLDEGGTRRDVASASYKTVASGGMYRVQDLLRGEDLLERAKLVTESNDILTPTKTLLQLRRAPLETAAELVLRQLVVEEQPLWLWAAVDGAQVQWENVPDTEQELLGDVLADADRREEFLLGVARTIETHSLAEIGSKGEEIVVAACISHLTQQDRPDLADKVCRVSLISDELGYDITSPDTAGNKHRIEVKTTKGVVDKVTFYISRNEAGQARRDAAWSLVVVALDRDEPVLGWCRGDLFADVLPVDVDPDTARWASAKVTVGVHQLSSGLPLDPGPTPDVAG